MPSKLLLQGFPPLASKQSRVLILGSMPGAASLKAQQYYAHPQNQFWPLMQELFGIDAALPYAQRARRLVSQGVAVWDVIESCERPGSLDSAIRNETVNDFPAFFAAHPRIRAVLLNGGKAETTFRRYALPQLGEALDAKTLLRMPSTSPAHASKTRAQKLREWSRIKEYLQA